MNDSDQEARLILGYLVESFRKHNFRKTITYLTSNEECIIPNSIKISYTPVNRKKKC